MILDYLAYLMQITEKIEKDITFYQGTFKEMIGTDEEREILSYLLTRRLKDVRINHVSRNDESNENALKLSFPLTLCEMDLESINRRYQLKLMKEVEGYKITIENIIGYCNYEKYELKVQKKALSKSDIVIDILGFKICPSYIEKEKIQYDSSLLFYSMQKTLYNKRSVEAIRSTWPEKFDFSEQELYELITPLFEENIYLPISFGEEEGKILLKPDYIYELCSHGRKEGFRLEGVAPFEVKRRTDLFPAIDAHFAALNLVENINSTDPFAIQKAKYIKMR